MSRLFTIAVLLIASAVATEAQRGSSSPRSATGRAVFTPAPDARGGRTVVRPSPTNIPRSFGRLRGDRSFGVATIPVFWGWGLPLLYVDSGVPIASLPDDGPTGGVQLDVTPWRSRVYVDGLLKGRVDDFKGYYHPLELVAGPHLITIVDEGYQPAVLDVVVTPGRTTTYRATLNEAASR
jgi:hypothetical protein